MARIEGKPKMVSERYLGSADNVVAATLAGIEETVLIYPSSGGRPKARRMLTDTTPAHNQLIDIFDLHRWAPRP